MGMTDNARNSAKERTELVNEADTQQQAELLSTAEVAIEQRRAYKHAYYLRHKELQQRRATDRDRARRQCDPAFSMVARSRKGAMTRGLEFTITAKDITPLPTHCPVLGTALDYAATTSTPPENTPSIDRMDSSKGYVAGNVAVISKRANLLKNDATIEEMTALLRYMLRSNERPCAKCGQTNRYPSGKCKVCHAAWNARRYAKAKYTPLFGAPEVRSSTATRDTVQ